MQSGEYLKHYAKDEHGNYVGYRGSRGRLYSRGEGSGERYRSNRDTRWRNEIEEGKKMEYATFVGIRREKERGIILLIFFRGQCGQHLKGSRWRAAYMHMLAYAGILVRIIIL